MSRPKDDFSKDVEAIFRKSFEINKQYLKQGTDLLREFGRSDRDLKNFVLPKPEVMMGAATSFTKMNLDHYQNMMELGFALTKKAFQQSPEETSDNGDDKEEEPSFVLSATSFAGETVSLQFLLDNTKAEEVICELVSSEYVDQKDPGISVDLPTVFKPQSFQLPPGIAQTVHIEISINDNITPGIYQSKVQVVGFEPAYFLIRLTLEEKPLQHQNRTP